ncbi:hypothetical protein ONJ87_28115, partial [Salmonella enterica subsp. enterica serovar Anatum]|nr:hypothetical protein [Salmonella enterica subsp. enterica serovar Anatum]
RTVNIDGKLHGAGANAFYEGIDDNGNMVRVPASAIAAPPTSAPIAGFPAPPVMPVKKSRAEASAFAIASMSFFIA